MFTPSATSGVPKTPITGLGKTTSIKVGLQALDAADDPQGSILMLNVDQPRSAAVIRQVLRAHHDNRDALITIPTCQGKGGHPHSGKSRPAAGTVDHRRSHPGDARRCATSPAGHPTGGAGRSGTALGRQHAGAIPGCFGSRRPARAGRQPPHALTPRAGADAPAQHSVAPVERFAAAVYRWSSCVMTYSIPQEGITPPRHCPECRLSMHA